MITVSCVCLSIFLHVILQIWMINLNKSEMKNGGEENQETCGDGDGCVVCEDGVVQQVQVFIVVGWCWIMGWWWLWIQYLMWWLMLLGSFFFFGWWWWVGWLLSWRIKINAKDWTCGNDGFHLVKLKMWSVILVVVLL